MSRHFLAQSLLLFLSVYVEFTYSKVHYITPSLDSPCPQNASSCLTLSKFAANSSHKETDISLLFLPGNHTLDQELLLAHGHNFSMSMYAQDNETVFIECTSQFVRFDISEAISVSMKGLDFIGCGSNRVFQVTQLTIADSTFQGVENNSTVLVINEVDTANIVRSQFLYNTCEEESKNIRFYLLDDEVNYIYQRNTSSGVLYIASSNVSVVSCRFMYNRADIGGALVANNSSLHIDRSAYSYNTADFGGAMVTSGSTIDIDNSMFTHNSAQHSGGVMVTSYSDRLSISNTIFTENSADELGGVVITFGNPSIILNSNTFALNTATNGGVMATYGNSSFTISNCNFVSNSVADTGGVVATFHDYSVTYIIPPLFFTYDSYAGAMATFSASLFTITSCTFTSNSAPYGAVFSTFYKSSLTISNSAFESNVAIRGGLFNTDYDSSFTVINSTFTNTIGGTFLPSTLVFVTFHNSSFTIINSTFMCTYNVFTRNGIIRTYDNSSFTISNSNFCFASGAYAGVILANNNSSFTINNCRFINKRDSETAVYNREGSTAAAVIQCKGGEFNINNCHFSSNEFESFRGLLISIRQCSTIIANSAFNDNVGSIYTFNSNLTFSGNSKFENSAKLFVAGNESSSQERGVITSFQSTVVFARESNTHFSNNRARDGGAMLAIESTIVVYGETTIANNNMTTIANSNGGGISLKQSRLEIRGKCNIFNNSAVRGGGIHATSSTIAVHTPGTLQIIDNYAEFGGGMYFEINSKFYVLKNIPVCPQFFCNKFQLINAYFLYFTGNHADYGGAVYVADVTNSGTCLPDNECFVQTLALHQTMLPSYVTTVNILFSENTATVQGSNLFGGLLDRCIPSLFAEVYLKQRIHYSGVNYLQNISNANINSISSQPVRVCFCNSEHEPDCSYKLPTITVKKGEAFNVSVVAVDQVNNTVDANITTSISSSEGGFGEGQQTQSVQRNCTDLTYNVFSPHDFETINLFADGPCGSTALSASHVTIKFTACTCPVGFQPLYNSNSTTRCECICDSKLSPFITHCDDNISSVFRVGTNSWITYINDTDPPGYIIYQNCPFDYCQPLTKNVSINFNLPNGADTQCAYNRTGVLCGSCRRMSSLSLASSRCLPCHSYWPADCVVILLAAILAGILLVTALLALNMTVSVGLINGFIFYANIVSAGDAVFFPSSESSFPSVFVSWLNLDIGINVCFIDGLDAYIKTWLQLAFPLYVTSLVVILIKVSEYSPRFVRLIGRKDPVSTLATLVLLSYSKLLSVTITALSFARLDYPDGNQEIVWLPDGNVKYFQGKHIPLVLVAVLIILIGLPYTILLFLWQWIVRAPWWDIFKWTRDTKLNGFITTYHVPHNSKYRYWTGLLLLVRVVFYVTASVTVSVNPQTLPLIAGILIGSLFLFKSLFSLRVYKNSLVDVVDTVLYFNLLALSLFSLYDFKVNRIKLTAVAYTSTIIIFFLFIGSICYHIRLLIKKIKPTQNLNEYPLAPVRPAETQVTHSVIELSKRDRSPPSDLDRDKLEITVNHRVVTPPHYTE